MSSYKCHSCGSVVQAEHNYCPECGTRLSEYRVCPNCKCQNKASSKYCQACGEQFIATAHKAQVLDPEVSKQEPSTQKEIEPPPEQGITIEFPFSTAQSFDFAVESAKRFESFRMFGDGRKAIHRVTFDEGMGFSFFISLVL